MPHQPDSRAWDDYIVLRSTVERNFKSLSCPAVIISQIQRSGGSLLSQLLDGHPQLCVHPSELKIGRPNKYYWPNLNLRKSPEQLFACLREHTTLNHAVHGYKKSEKSSQSYRFIFSASIQREIFCKLVDTLQYKRSRLSQRDILDCYITSYFNSWIDYNGNIQNAQYWCAFVARALTYPVNVRAFFTDYSDGKLVHIIREPKSWYASARVYNANKYGNLNVAKDIWSLSAKSALRNLAMYPDSVLLLTFDDLLLKTQSAMGKICSFLSIEYSDTMLTPTFNGFHIYSNSSFADSIGMINKAPDN